MRIYIESTIPSLLTARPSRALIRAAQQQITRDWWDAAREKHELFTSSIVLEEIAKGDPKAALQRSEAMAGITVLPSLPDVGPLIQRILRGGVLPPKAQYDAAHIALATMHRMDALLSWNCRHIANMEIQSRLRAIARDMGLELPVLCTPQELTGDSVEQAD